MPSLRTLYREITQLSNSIKNLKCIGYAKCNEDHKDLKNFFSPIFSQLSSFVMDYMATVKVLNLSGPNSTYPSAWSLIIILELGGEN